jgi:hypothetical protein
MFGCFNWCSSCFGNANQEARRRNRGRRRVVQPFALEDELIVYDELQIEEAAVRADQVAEAARIAERRDLAPSLRDESLIARITLSLNAQSSHTMDTLNSDENDSSGAVNTSIPSAAIFVQTLQTLGDRKVIPVVIESLWNATRHRWRKRETTRLLSLFQLAVTTALGQTSQQELLSIILDLPPAVMGDAQAQQSSRVLVDVARDVREEMMSRRSVLSPSGRRQVDSAVAAFDTQLKSLEVTGASIEAEQIELIRPPQKPLKAGSVDPHIALYFDIMIALLLEIAEFDRFRILLSQLLLSKQIPADTTLRSSVLELVFPSRPPTPQVPTLWAFLVHTP